MPNKKKFIFVSTLIILGAIIYITEALIGYQLLK